MSPGHIPFLAHTHTHSHTGEAESPAILGSPCLPREVDWECRLWEEMTMFIVWIKYFSWPPLCCSVSFFFFFSFSPPQHPKHIHFPSLLPEALRHARRKSALKNTERDREGTGLASAQKAFWDASLPSATPSSKQALPGPSQRGRQGEHCSEEESSRNLASGTWDQLA